MSTPIDRMIIGCTSLVVRRPWENPLFLGIDCSKGRGKILPGGRWEKGETFHQTAARELKEETGVTAVKQEMIFGGMCNDGAYVYTFLTEIRGDEDEVSSPEGEVGWWTWHQLLSSDFRPYYSILKEIFDARQK